ncbi:Tripartite tricarboxylate transporter family receptor [compost metagenome]|uniref:Tripartite-type tricarboxylate transporter receptor subunit TctC n=1 Tax=Variovorax boronicumulans TaxID=436515 RepID=A0AAW8E043_9BURK|nr:tripartite tricarboxylate transporter substrate binding protein [Variovorax boronicumulans]MDP9880126.1 tripartite-type tricarboxylate transporter receptor subunit TctC [Variovorax boronicumulans]MDP9925150.1 tripartite-type tricarboxylate transporter receptor subunit TctC [Variovorax boronicumulans]
MNPLSKMLRAAAFTAALASAAAPFAQAQPQQAAATYPSKPIHFVVPFPPGSGTDVGARFFARKLGELAGQPVIVENRAGANGFIAVKAVTSAPADGYTLLMGSNSTLATNVALFKQLPYDPVKDLAPVSTLMRSPIVLIVPANSPYKTLKDLIDAARAKPGQRTYASGSAAYQLMGELFADKAGIQLLNVPYKGAPDAVNATLSGQTDLGFSDITATMELLRGGKIRALAIAADQRLAGLPDVPTAQEQGIGGFSADTWTGVAVAANTPKPVVDKLSDMFVKILAMPETREFYARQNVITMKGGQDELRDFQREQIAVWKRIAAAARIELQ